MRLFASGAFYLHNSPKVAAEWLNDRDTISQCRNTGVLLSTVIQYHVCERDTRLYPIDRSCHVECKDVVEWMHASRYNIYWMVSYYEDLAAKCTRCFKNGSPSYEFMQALNSYYSCFDDIDTDQNWLPLTTSDARDVYRSTVKKYQYRRVRLPQWLTVEREPCEQPQPVSSELDLLSFDLDS